MPTCKGSGNVLFGKQLTEKQQKKVKEWSKQRKDGLKLKDWNYLYHQKNCYADYISSHKIARCIRKSKKRNKMPHGQHSKKLRR